MLRPYPRNLTLLILLLSAAGAVAGVAVQSNTPTSADATSPAAVCTPEVTNETRQIVSDTYEIAGGENREFSYQLGDADQLSVEAQTLAGRSPSVTVTDGNGRTLTERTDVVQFSEAFSRDRGDAFTIELSNAEHDYPATVKLSVTTQTQRVVSEC